MIIKIQFHLFASINFNQGKACPKITENEAVKRVEAATSWLYLRVITAECCHTK